MSDHTVVKIGVLGLASIATRSVIPAIIDLPDKFELSGVASRELSKAGREYGCQAYGDYESLLSDENIGAVYIPLPNSLHYTYVKQALENGKHVIVEKSLGCSLDEVAEMVKIARENDLALLENFQFRFHSQLQKILELVGDGVIGELRSVRVSFGFPPFPDEENIRYKPELGGGALLDAGAYAMKIAPFFLGEQIQLVHGAMSFDQQKRVDVWGGGVLQQQNGPLFCHFSYGFDHYYQCALELWGSAGKLFTNRIFTAPPGLRPKLLIESQEGVEERLLDADDHFKKIMEYFYRLIVDGEVLDVEYEHNANLLQAKLIEQFKRIAIKG